MKVIVTLGDIIGIVGALITIAIVIIYIITEMIKDKINKKRKK